MRIPEHRVPRTSARGGKARDHTGSLLVMAIWTLTIFSLMGLGVARMTSSQMRLVKRLEERLICQELASAAVLDASLERKRDETPYDTLFELRSPRQRALGRGAFQSMMVDEESRININTAPQQILARLPGFGLDGAVAITTSTLRPFRLKQELLVLDDVTQEMWLHSREWVTVYGTGKVNLNTAPAEVLKTLGLEDDLVDLIIRYRAGDDGQEGTEDDGVFTQAGGIIDDLRAFTGLSVAQEAVLLSLLSQGLLDVASTHVSLQVQTSVLGRPALAYTIVLDATTGKVKQWEEF